MSENQKRQFNLMLSILRKIGKDYQTPNRLRKTSEKEYGLGYEEALEYAYENIQSEARSAIKGVKHIAD